MVSHCRPCPAATGLWYEGFAPRPHCYEEIVVQPELALFKTNEGNQEFPFHKTAVHQALPVDVI